MRTPLAPLAPFSPSRRRLLRAALAGGAALLAGCREPPPLIATLHPFPPYHLLQWASGRAAYPIRWNTVATASQQRHRLRFRQAQVGLLTLDEALRERALGTPLVVIGMIDQSEGTDQLLVRPGWEAPERLRTARVAVEATGVGALTYLSALRHFGLPLDWSRVVAISPAEQLDAWKSGRVEAVVTYDPFAQAIRAAGGILLFDSRQMPPLILDVIVAYEAALELHAEGLRALLTSWVEGVAAWQRDPQPVAAALAPLAGLPPEGVAEAFAGVHLFDCGQNRAWLTRGLRPICQQIVQLLTVAGFGPFPVTEIPTTPRFLPPCPEAPA